LRAPLEFHVPKDYLPLLVPRNELLRERV